MKITLGDLIETTITVEVDDVRTDPGSITLRYRHVSLPVSEVVVNVPDPLNPPAPVERLGVGSYRALLDLPTAGDWRIRWVGTAPAQSASEAEVKVRSIY